ncbi:MAG: BatA domain-containing protein [Gemmatimonadetes bacterium]|nr:BatA domain-containing protein [Gemmatimonadota bacterium]
MITALVPAFLAAGVALAMVPIALHFIARRPPDLRPLPTARFLTEDARTFLRVRRTPSDVRLLLVRIGFALLLGASFAGMTWTADRAGMGHVVLLDASVDALGDWNTSVALARAAVEEGPAASGAVLVAYGLDGPARVVRPEELETLERGERRATLEGGLRGLRAAIVSDTRFEDVAVTWVVRPTWAAWSAGLGPMRSELWPGRIDVRAVPSREAEAVGASDGAGVAVGSTAGGDTTSLGRALSALGGAGTWVFAESPSAEALAPLLDRARAGATVVLSGRLPATAATGGLPWIAGTAEPNGGRGGLALASGIRLGTALPAQTGEPAPGARVLAVFEDATPAAVAHSLGDGCVAYLATGLHGPALTANPDYPALVESLGRGCVVFGDVDGPLDVGALRTLEGPSLEAEVNVASLAASQGVPLTRWLVLLALLFLLAEVALTRSGRPREATS